MNPPKADLLLSTGKLLPYLLITFSSRALGDLLLGVCLATTNADPKLHRFLERKAVDMRTFIELLSILISVVAGDAWGNMIVYTVTDLGNLGGSDGAIAKAINNSGEVIGYGYLSGNTYYHAFIYSGGTMHDIGTGGIYSYAERIN